ncbi:hypothetical protein TcWFU_003801 [Taenia crassiceps]|uniref:Uncharacterized protein n=1 Tax=Taenia crassiceps TaxID=6207 RepID=A0ABR4QGR5_9CEST
MRGLKVSAGKAVNPPNKETVELGEEKKGEFRVEEKVPHVDIVGELNEQVTGGTVYQEDKKRKTLRIGKKRTTNTEALVKDVKKKFTYPRPHHIQTKVGSPMDFQATLNGDQSSKLPNGDFEARARHVPMKGRLFRHSDHSNEQESIKKPITDKRKSRLGLPAIEPESLGTKIPPQHPKIVLKKRTDPRPVMSPLKFPFFSSDTLDEISWSEFTRDPENEGITDSHLQSSPGMLFDKSMPAIALISPPNVENLQTNEDGVATKSRTNENVELEPLPLTCKEIRSPSTHQPLSRYSDLSRGGLKDGRDEVTKPLRLNFKGRSLDAESIDLPQPSADLAQSKIQPDTVNPASSGRKFLRPKLSPIPEAVPIPLSSADKRIRLMGTHDKKGDGKEEGSTMSSTSEVAMQNQRFSKLPTDRGVTVQHKRIEEHVQTPKPDYLRVYQSPQSRHRQKPVLGSVNNPHELVVHARSQPREQPESASQQHSKPTSSKQSLPDSHAKPSSHRND